MIVSIAQAQFFFLALTRILATIIHVPVLAGRMVPDPVKIGLGLLLTLVLVPWQPHPESEMPFFAFSFAIAQELLIGTLAGFAAELTFAALQIAGNLMGVGSGFSASQIMNPALGDSGSAMDQIFLMMTFLLFLVMNGHHIFLLGLKHTFTILPLNSSLSSLLASQHILGRVLELTAGLISVGVQLSLPVMGTLLLTDLTLGLLARVAPQVHVFFLGLPLKVGVGLLLLGLSISLLFPTLRHLFETLAERTLALVGA